MPPSRALALTIVLAFLLVSPSTGQAPDRYVGPDGHLRIALVEQPFLPNGTSQGPATMADGGIQDALRAMGAVVRTSTIGLTAAEDREYGGMETTRYGPGTLRRHRGSERT